MTFILPLTETKHDSIAILTDFEPDDLMGLMIFLNWFCENHGSQAFEIPILVITGEGDKDKTVLARNFMRHFHLVDNVQVSTGDLSGTPFPQAICELYAREDFEPAPADNVSLGEFLDEHDRPLIISLKPPREFLHVSDAIFSKCVLLQYGSFNFREMFKIDPKESVAEMINTAFKQVILYESYFASGQNNSADPVNAKNLFDVLSPELGIAIAAWSNQICRACVKSVHEISCQMLGLDPNDPELARLYARLHRNEKIIGKVLDGGGSQVVLADQGLLTCAIQYEETFFFDQVNGTIAFDSNGYTVHTPSENGPVRLIRNVPFDDLIEEMVDGLA